MFFLMTLQLYLILLVIFLCSLLYLLCCWNISSKLWNKYLLSFILTIFINDNIYLFINLFPSQQILGIVPFCSDIYVASYSLSIVCDAKIKELLLCKNSKIQVKLDNILSKANALVFWKFAI